MKYCLRFSGHYISQNIQLRFIYEMIEKDTEKKYHEESFKSYLNLYF